MQNVACVYFYICYIDEFLLYPYDLITIGARIDPLGSDYTSFYSANAQTSYILCMICAMISRLHEPRKLQEGAHPTQEFMARRWPMLCVLDNVTGANSV